MATVQFTFFTPMFGIAPTFSGQPRGEAVTAGGATSLTVQGNEVVRAKATSGASYVRLGGAGATGATTGYHLSEGEVIEMHGSPGDAARQDDA